MMIREAVATDAETLNALYKELVPTSQNIHVLPERVEQIRQDPHNFLFAYEEADRIIGTVFLTLCMDPVYEFRPYGLVEYIFVREEARGKGIGGTLLRHVEEMCIAKHCTRISLMSNAERADAHKFFEHKGYNGTKSKAFKKYIRVTPVDWSNVGG